MRFLLSVLLLCVTLFGGIAEVTRLEGEATQQQGRLKSRPLALHDSLDENTTIITAPRSKVKLRFDDGTLITIGPDSAFDVVKYKNDPEAPSAEFSMARGVFRALTGQIGKIAPERFRIATPNAALGIRGTHFAGSYRNGMLGVVYLGLGHGVTVTNAEGNTLLEAPGDGVFLVRDHYPGKERWSEEQASELLSQVQMEGEKSVRIDRLEGFAADGSIRYLYSDAVPDMLLGPAQRHHDAIFILNATSPFWHGFRLDASFYYRNSFIESGIDLNNTCVLANANIVYRNHWLKVVAGRQEIQTSLLAVAPIRPDFTASGFETWQKRASVQDWRWELPLNEEAIYIRADPVSDLRLHGAYIHKVRPTRSNDFVKIGDIAAAGLSNSDHNSSVMLLYGIQYGIDHRWRLEYWGTYLTNLYAKNYAEVSYRSAMGAGTLLAQGQYLALNGMGSVRQTIDLSLAGLRLGGSYSGASMALSFTQTSKTSAGSVACIPTPFDGAVAFTNTFAFRTAAIQNGCGGPYGSDTTAVLLYGGYDFNRVGLAGVESFVNYALVDKGGAPERAIAFDFDLSYTVSHYQNITFDFKYS